MTLESKENYPRHTKIVQNSLGFMPEVKPSHKPRGDLVLCALTTHRTDRTFTYHVDDVINHVSGISKTRGGRGNLLTLL